MPRDTLKPGDIIAVDPVKPGYTYSTAVIAENGEDIYFAYTNIPWTARDIPGWPGLTAQEAEEVIRGKREYPGAVIYKVWDEAEGRSFEVPESVALEIDRRQSEVTPATPPEDAENLGKIPPKPIDFDAPPSGGLW